jgi:hypothetical protein
MLNHWVRAGVLAAALALNALSATAQTPPKAFQRDDLAATAQQIEERLKREISVSAAADLARLVQQGEAALARDPRAALPFANQAVVAHPNAIAGWRLLARSAKALVPRDWRERYEMQERATAAAYIAYQRARTRPEEAQTLALLADVFEWREMWRPALTAYRLSLEAGETAPVRTAYEALREKRGFRLTGNETDSDSATPRACFTFSEPLARGRTDFAPYVAVTGRGDFAVTAEDSQLCVEGLRHGERYAIVLRQGIPSAIPGESLLKNADYEIYVRDRTPSVRASGKTYVLPKSGQQGIPVTSVNTGEIGIRVLRIGDRNLINTVRGGEFMEQIEDYQLRKIIDETGQQVWQGVLTAKNDLNRDVVTAFPVTEAVGRLEPGVYLLAARAGEFKARPVSGDDVGDAEQIATQWFVVSDIGITSFSGPDGVHVITKSLADAKPMANAEIRLIARNNEVLGTARTNAEGHARFEPGLGRGEGGLAPGLVTAALAGDYGFLDIQKNAFDLSDRGVSGRVAPKGLDAYLYAERGVYRPGETVYVSALLRDPKGIAVTGMPLTLVVRRPDGMEYRRVAVEDQGAGGRALSVPLISGAPVGTWRVQAYSDPRRPAIGEATFLVEDYVPERLEVTLSPLTKPIKSGQAAEIDVAVKYLYGAPGADLAISGDATVRVAKSSVIPGFDGYRVGVADEPVEPVKAEFEEKPTTDEKGNAKLVVELKEPETRLPLEAEFQVTASESGGRGVTRSVVIPILPKGNVIGVKPLFADGELGDGATARFGVIMATGEGKRLARAGLKWQLSRVSRNYQWYFKEGRWAYEGVKTTRRIADGEVATSESAVAEIAARVGWGTYRIEVRASGNDDAETAFEFTTGYVSDARADTPDVLDLVLDKKNYAAGEPMQIRLNPRFAGTVTLAVISDRVAHLKTVEVPEAGITVPLQASAEWGAGAYLVALAHRPLDARAQRMPGRAIGLAWFSIDRAARRLEVSLNAPQMVRPRGTLDLPLKIANLRAGEEAFVTVAAVDVGILNLTRYPSPDASAHFLGQRQISGEWRDLYGYLIDGMQATRGQVRSGGDAAPEMKGEKPTQEPLARYSGVVKAGPDGVANIRFDLPAFNGAVRVMAVAWSKDRVGEANAEVIIRDPIVVQATAPRFLALGDRSRLHVEINNVEGEAGDYALDIDLKGPLAAELDPALRRLRLEKGRKAEATLPVIGAGLGVAEIGLTLKGPNTSLSQTLRLAVKSSAPNVVNRIVRPLPAGQSLVISNDLLADLVPRSGAVSVAVSPFAGIDAAGLLASLDRYPYGCTEQTVSRALPLLYVNRLASLEQLGFDDGVDARITGAIERVMARQGANGAFGLWGIGGSDLWLDAFVADFLTRARERNFAVPQVGFTLALDNLRNRVVNAGDVRGEEAAGLAYAIYVLARNGRPIMGDLRYLADNKLNDFASPLAKAQLGAGLALLGDRARAKRTFDAAIEGFATVQETGGWRIDYGSKLRDGAGLLALLAEAEGERAQLQRVSTEVDRLRGAARYTSTQEQMWMVLAVQALAKEAEGFTLEVDGQSHRGALNRALSEARLEGRPVTLRNSGQSDARVTLSVSGIPLQPQGPAREGYAVERKLFSLAGDEIKPDQLKQNERYVVKLTVNRAAAIRARLLVVDPLPAGLEIENANLGGAASTEGLGFLGDLTPATHTEARDDRFVAAFEDEPGPTNPAINIAYVVRAVTPGTYTHPAAFAEDMYRPQRFGRTGFGSLTIARAGR